MVKSEKDEQIIINKYLNKQYHWTYQTNLWKSETSP